MKRILAVLLSLGILFCLTAAAAHAQETDGSQEVPASIIGDADGDQAVTIMDATFIQRHLLDIRLPFLFNESGADADEDDSVSIMDVTSIQRWLNNTGKRLNIGEEVIPWFDKADAYAADYFEGGLFTIIRICQKHLYVYSEYYNYLYRLNYDTLSDAWSVGEEVWCSFNNLYYPQDIPETNFCRAEGDLVGILKADDVPDPYVAYKPVIYLYPEEETEVSVQLDIDGSFLYTTPAYEDGWKVTAAPDGTLTAENGKTYPYLFWEANLNTEYDFSEGFCVSGSDTETFLRDSLAKMGLNEKETEDFIGFWLPLMEDNPYNVISFQTTAYTDAAALNISPQPDTTIRVFMAWYDSDEAVNIPAQTLPSAQRSGFTAVEWGGAYAPVTD